MLYISTLFHARVMPPSPQIDMVGLDLSKYYSFILNVVLANNHRLLLVILVVFGDYNNKNGLNELVNLFPPYLKTVHMEPHGLVLNKISSVFLRNYIYTSTSLSFFYLIYVILF